MRPVYGLEEVVVETAKEKKKRKKAFENRTEAEKEAERRKLREEEEARARALSMKLAAVAIVPPLPARCAVYQSSITATAERVLSTASQHRDESGRYAQCTAEGE